MAIVSFRTIGDTGVESAQRYELRKARLRKVSIVGVCATSGSLVPTFLRSALLRAQLELLRRWVAAVPLSGAGQLRPQDLMYRFFTKTGLLDET
jgi:hypothetical protein